MDYKYLPNYKYLTNYKYLKAIFLFVRFKNILSAEFEMGTKILLVEIAAV